MVTGHLTISSFSVIRIKNNNTLKKLIPDIDVRLIGYDVTNKIKKVKTF